MDETLTRQIKIYCPQHQTIFDAAKSPKIVCEIREHSLSNDFPRAEFWEYCCDCQTFSPSQFGTGGKVKDACPHCGRETVRRFLCDECKIVSFDSTEDTKGKNFNVNPAKGIEPDCPGCQKSFGAASPQIHNCPDIEGALLTHHKKCPFCQKSVVSEPISAPSAGAATTKFERPNASTQCPRCGHWGMPERRHCGKCGVQMKAHDADIPAGTEVPRTQLLGSICPNCGSGNKPDSVFCLTCGQALKTIGQTGTSNLAQPNFSSQTMPPKVTSNESTGTFNIEPPQTASTDSNKVLFLILGALMVFVVFGIIIAVSSKDTGTTNTNASPTPNPLQSEIGKEARLNTDVNLRSSASPNAAKVGVLYLNTKVKILDVKRSDTGTLWYQVKVISYGCSKNSNLGCGKDNPSDRDEGWAFGENVELPAKKF